MKKCNAKTEGIAGVFICHFYQMLKWDTKNAYTLIFIYI